MKKELSGCHFNSDDDVIAVVYHFLDNQHVSSAISAS